jgi:IclR family transcriptional regulator, acetate operon repressor
MAEPTQLDEREPRVQSVARAIRILLAVGQSPSGLKGSQIAAATGLPKQATYHLVHTLVTTGMITRNERGLYVLGLRIGTLAEGFRRQLAPPEHLAPVVRRISSETGETAYASGWWNGEIVTLATSPGMSPVLASEVPHGTYTDSHARASGKLLLAFAAEDTRSRYLSSHELTARTKMTITVLPKLYKEFDRIREAGYALDCEEYSQGLCCIAVPIDAGSLPYALTVSAPVDRFRKNFTQYLETILGIARGISGSQRDSKRQELVNAGLSKAEEQAAGPKKIVRHRPGRPRAAPRR